MSTDAPRPLIACPHCASLYLRQELKRGGAARCVRCETELYRYSGVSMAGWLALTITALITLAIANYFPIATLRLMSQTVDASFPEAVVYTWQQGYPAVAVMTGLFGLVVPLVQLLFLLWALLAISSGRLPDDFPAGMRVLRLMAPWSMVPVLMLGILVAIVKLSGLAVLYVGAGLWAFAALTVLLTVLGRLSAQRLWRAAEDRGLVAVSGSGIDGSRLIADCHACGYVQNLDSAEHGAACARCGASVHFRKPDSSTFAWALALTACILYIPANILPVMTFRSPVGETQNTILGGVIELWNLGSWDLALIVFIASIVVPMTKLLVLMALLVRRRWHGIRIQRQRTRLYELVEFIGQWSMLDVFVVVLLTAMVDFPGVSQISAGPAAGSFGLVVVLTMFAAFSFDPRHGWDRQPPAQREYVDNADGT